MITRQIEHVALLLLIAAVVAMLARKAHLPYTVGLLLTGFGLALLRSAPTFHLSKELIFSAFLSPLIFEAAFYLPWRELRRDLLYILFLASAGVLLAAGVTGVGMHYGVAWAWPTALLFGVLIAATDPVSVIATFKETRVPERLKIIVEAESLFNDGTAAVAFGVALAVVQGGDLTGAGISRERGSHGSGHRPRLLPHGSGRHRLRGRRRLHRPPARAQNRRRWRKSWVLSTRW